MKKFINISALIIIISFAFLMLSNPEICLKSTVTGVLLCGNVIIPSIYPFSFCVFFLNNSGILEKLRPVNPITTRFFGLNYREFTIFLISLIGGYPIGAKILSNEKIEKTDIMINYCINAGPAFIILSIGKGIFKSEALGWILFSSHILSSFIIMIFLRPFSIKQVQKPRTKKPMSAVDNFVLSASDAAETIIKICGLVILFSCLNGYINNLPHIFSYLSRLCEVTNAVFLTKNIYLISFLLGFSGFSIWAQVFSLTKNVKINYMRFVFFRLFHGGLSSLLTFTLLKIFKITIPTLSNGVSFNPKSFINGPAVAVSLIIMGIILIISLYNKKYAGNLIEDIV